MGNECIPPLTQDEIQRAANAAAAIITRCNMVADDGFVDAKQLLTVVQRNITRGSILDVNLEGLSAVLAHPTIRRKLGQYGFKFQMYRSNGDKWYHNSSGRLFWMYRLGSNISDRNVPKQGSDHENEQVEKIRESVFEICRCTSPVSEVYIPRPFILRLSDLINICHFLRMEG